MTSPTNGAAGKSAAPTGSTALAFQAPPSTPDDHDPHDEPTRDPHARSARSGGARGGTGRSGANERVPRGGELRMLKGAREAASGMKISDDEIRAVLEDPQDVQPDPRQPQRTRLSRGGLTITTGNDGMILRVTRKR